MSKLTDYLTRDFGGLHELAEHAAGIAAAVPAPAIGGGLDLARQVVENFDQTARSLVSSAARWVED